MDDPMHELKQDMLAMQGQIDSMRQCINATSEKVVAMHNDITEVLDIFKSLKGGFKVMGWLGQVAKWVATITAGVAAVWALFHFPKSS